MRYFLLPLLFLLLACSDADRKTPPDTTSSVTTIYLSRHAEKAAGEDPELLPAGTDRAQRLADRLAGERVAAVYATSFRRTQATAQPTADRIGKRTKKYSASANADRQTKQWLRRHQGETILVVGHSNTVPGLVNALIGEQRYGDIGEEEYGRLFRVEVTGDGTATVEELSTD